MRTTLNIPPKLLQEAQKLLEYTSKTDTIIFALRELLRRKRIDEIKGLAGQVQLDIDIDHSRRRSKTF